MVEFERIAKGIVEPAQNDIHRLQAGQGFEKHRLITHREICPLYQGITQIAGQIGVFKVRFVIWSGRQQDNAGIVAVARRQVHERLSQGDKKRCKPL